MPSLVILGASGFLGRAMIAHRYHSFPVKAIARSIPSDADLHPEGVTWYQADFLHPHALDHVLENDDIVINLAYLKEASDMEHIRMINNIIGSCLQKDVSRLIHCSTAVVVGASKDAYVNEETRCLPVTQYEKSKYYLERCVLEAGASGLDVAILRPTAIVGPNGQNLVKLADSLINGNRVVNYFRACLFGRRNMHLVPVRNVVAAMLYLASEEDLLNGNIYIISSEDSVNNFISVESILLKSLGLCPRKVPILPIPFLFLSMFLKLKGSSESNVGKVYDSSKLLATNFTPVDSITDAVSEFGKNFLKKNATKVTYYDNKQISI
ncbi:MAG: NAD-dependent epimerase/dehydratase family protein [Legionellales bacterium]|nr:NAD-dependent epimerase/dehydratase family protein [Legionellales bacterium]